MKKNKPSADPPNDMKMSDNQSLFVNCFNGAKSFLNPLVNPSMGRRIINPKKCSTRAINEDPLGITIAGVSSRGNTTPGEENIRGYLTGASKALAALASETIAGPNFSPLRGSSIVI